MPDLESVLATVRGRIAHYRGQGIGEQDTKAALIVPVLRALGWDTEDLEDVKLEYKRRPADNPVDYALVLLREPRLFIEAKSLGAISTTTSGRTRSWPTRPWPGWSGWL